MAPLILVLLFICFPVHGNPWGKDADLCTRKAESEETCCCGPLERFAEVAIRFHKEVISPTDGPRSHYRPSSSTYTLDAIRKHGFFYGWFLGCDRLMRENNDPWVYRTIVNENGFITKWDPVR